MENTNEIKEQLTECLILLNKYGKELHGYEFPFNDSKERERLIRFSEIQSLPKLKELISYRYCLKLEDSVMDNTHLRVEMVKIYDEIMEHSPYKKDDPEYPKYREEIATLLPHIMRMSIDERTKYLVEFNSISL